MFGRKGQSALEYLMTYGWAILIIIVVGGVLYYYGVFSPGKIVGESKVGFSKVDIDTWSVDPATNSMNIMFWNKVGKDINITEVDVGTQTYTISGGHTLSSGAKDSTFVTGITTPSINAGDAYKWDVTIKYYLTEDTAKTELRSSGTLSGTA